MKEIEPRECYVWGVISLCCWKMSRRKLSVLARVKVELKSEDLVWIKSRFLYDEVSDFLVTARNISKASRRRSATPICSSGSNRLGWGWRRSRYVYTHHRIINFRKLIFLTTLMQWVDIVAFTIYVTTVSSKKRSRELSDMSGAMKKKADSNIARHVFVDKSNFFPGQTFLSWLCGWLAVGSIWFTLHSTCCVLCVQVKIDIYLEEYESESYMRV